MQRAWRKYSAVLRIAVSNNLVYVADFFVRSLFLVVILYVFVQLWTTTYAATGRTSIGGLTLSDMIWYLILTESIVMGAPRLNERIEEEVKGGEIGYRLNRPIGYLLYHYFSYMGEGAVRFAVNLIIGTAVGLLLLDRVPFTLASVAGYLILAVGAFTVNYLLSMAISLTAFWLEDTKGIQFVYTKLVLALGGTMIPLDLFPKWLYDLTMWLPFQAVAYIPAKIGVAFDAVDLAKGMLLQVAWVGGLILLVVWIYRKGVKQLHVNGG